MPIRVVHSPYKRTKDVYRAFDEVGLPLQVSDSPVVRGSRLDKIFQLDIRHRLGKRGREEHFVSFFGDDSNDVTAPFRSEEKHQLILRVHEPQREFIETVRRALYDASPDRLKNRRGIRVVKTTNKEIYIARKTSEQTSKYLVGQDDNGLFMAQLGADVTSMETAWESLKPLIVKNAEREGQKVVRQGDFFALQIPDTDRSQIELFLSKNQASIQNKLPVSTLLGVHNSRNKHIAEEAVTFNYSVVKVYKRFANDPDPVQPPFAEFVKEYASRMTGRLNYWGVGTGQTRLVFIRGYLRHVQHPSRHFSDWTLIVPNTENTGLNYRSDTAPLAWGSWID